MQPANRTCSCPLLTENWYLQWGVEMGVLGLLLSLMIPFFVLRKTEVVSHPPTLASYGRAGKAQMNWPILAFLGISVAGLFLHSFEDAAVAYSVWLLLGQALLISRL